MKAKKASGRSSSYFDAFRYFGAHSYGPGSTGEHKSQFDYKQVRFLRPVEVIDFTEGKTLADRRENLRRVIDDKLQLELVPYGSSDFSGRRFPSQLLRPHFERVMGVIAAHPRQYVIFCGSIFAKLLPSGAVGDEHAFDLTKKDGSEARQRSRFANLRIPWRGHTIAAGLAHSWAKKGIPMDAYAREILARYRSTPQQSSAVTGGRGRPAL